MMIVTAKLRKKRLLFCGLLALLAAALLFAFARPKSAAPDGSSEEKRLAYLASLGWEADPKPVETLTLQLKQPLREPFLSFNEMQKLQGFDLSALGDTQLRRYTYALRNHPAGEDCRADLYVCDGKIVAGDIIRLGENGFISDLRRPVSHAHG